MQVGFVSRWRNTKYQPPEIGSLLRSTAKPQPKRTAAVVEDPAAACWKSAVLRLVLRTQPRSEKSSRLAKILGDTARWVPHLFSWRKPTDAINCAYARSATASAPHCRGRYPGRVDPRHHRIHHREKLENDRRQGARLCSVRGPG